MRYLEGKKLFLFSMVNDCLRSLDHMDDDEFNSKIIIENANRFLLSIPKNFVEIIFRIVYQYTTSLNLNLFGVGKTIGISHIRNIYKGIVIDYRVKNILKNIDASLQSIISNENFDIKNYSRVAELIEELDLVCIFEIYSYLLGEDVDSVLSFVLDKLVESLCSGNNLENSNEILSCIENKIEIFKKLYDDEDISLVSKTEECVIYKFNDVLKMVHI